ncbi:unnamed protein product, partial [Ilex paraguariensis]
EDRSSRSGFYIEEEELKEEEKKEFAGQTCSDGRGIRDPTGTMEELYSLLLITGHVLADEGQGETPLVPKAIQRQFMDAVETDKHPVVILSG